MGIAPGDQAAESIFEFDRRTEADLPRRPLRRAYAVADERRIAARRVFDRLIATCTTDQQLGEIHERRSLTGADIVKAVDGLRAHCAEIRMGAILNGDKIECLAA